MAEEISELDDFRQYFKEHYETNLEKHLSNVGKSKFFNPLWPVLFLLLLIGIDRLTVVEFTGFLAYLAVILMVMAPVFDAIRGKLERLNDNLGMKDVLSYYLLKASESFEAYSKETAASHTDTAQKFLDQSLEYVRQFGNILRKIVNESRLPLNIPDIEQLGRLQENVMNRIYPMLQSGREMNRILLTLSRFFFYEKEYVHLPGINELIEANLGSTPFLEEEKGIRRLVVEVKRSYFIASAVLFALSAVAVLLGAYLLRMPFHEKIDFWMYISENALTVIIGILTLWAPIVVAIRPRYQ